MKCEDCGSDGAVACELCEKATCQSCAEGEERLCDCLILTDAEVRLARRRRLAARRLTLVVSP